MSERVNNPYLFSQEEKLTISQHFHVHNDWAKSAFIPLKQNLLQHLRQEQQNKCAYCKRDLGFDHKDVEIEHILSKSDYPSFTFHPKNLVLSCPGCNLEKGSHDVVINKPISLYPSTGSNISIVHGHFDNYSDHIEIRGGAVYIGRSVKGCETIKLCKIFRLRDVLERQREHDTGSNQISQLVEALRNSSEEERGQLVQVLSDITGNFGNG